MRLLPLALLLALPQAAPAAPPVIVEASYPGASAPFLAGTVTTILEETVAGIEGVRSSRSLSLNDGRCFIRLELEPGADPKQVRVALAKRLESSRRALAEVSGGTVTGRLLPAVDESFGLIALWPSDQSNLAGLSARAQDTLLPRLQRFPVIARTVSVGAVEDRLRIVLAPERLAAHGLTARDVLPALSRALAKPPTKAADAGQVVVAERDGNKVRLRDVAAARSTSERQQHAYAGVPGDAAGKEGEVSPAVLLVVQPRPGSAEPLRNVLDWFGPRS
jgi:multidrug efflux pump subunit AcrB